MSQLQKANPTGFNYVQTAMNVGKNPQELLQTLMKEKNISGNQLTQLKQQAKGYGVPDNVLNKLG